MNDPRVPYRPLEDTRRVTLEGQLVDENGRPIQGTTGWRQHPLQSRTRRLQPMGHSQPTETIPSNGYELMAPQQAAPSVTVNNNGTYYRPWKEELLISGWKSAGNLLAWPFRLIGGFIESIVQMFAGVLKIALLAVILPSLLFAGLGYYQANKDRPAAEMAHDIGKTGVGLVGSVLGGIWDGMFGDDEPAAPAKPAPKEGAGKN